MALLRSKHVGSQGSSLGRWIAAALVVMAIVAWAGLQDRILQTRRPARSLGPMRGAAQLVGKGSRWAGPDQREQLAMNTEGMATIDDAGEGAGQPAHGTAATAENNDDDDDEEEEGGTKQDKDDGGGEMATAGAAEPAKGDAGAEPTTAAAAESAGKEVASAEAAAGAAAELAKEEPAKEEPAAEPAKDATAADPATTRAVEPAKEEPAAEPAKDATTSEPAAAATAEPAKEEPAAEPAKEASTAEPATTAAVVQEPASKPEEAAGEATGAKPEASGLTAKDTPSEATPKATDTTVPTVPATAGQEGAAPGTGEAKPQAQKLAQQAGQMAKEELTAESATKPAGAAAKPATATPTKAAAAAPAKATRAVPKKAVVAAAGTTSSTAATATAASKGVAKLCTNTCPTAGNGVCEDGRPKPGTPGKPTPPGERDPDVYLAVCDLGTDCNDCGAWEFPASGDEEALSWRPVADILAKNFTINVRQTATPQPYWFAYTDPKQDVDVSRQMQDDAVIEKGISGLWNRILKEGCVGPDGKRRLVLDVGANFGYYTLMAASLGCRVIAWEPVPYFAAFLKYGLLRNNFTDRVELRESVVGDEHGGELTIVVPNRGIWGTAGVNGMNIDRAINNQGDYDEIKRKAERLDEIVKEDVLLMKVDVEGFEPAVLRSAAGLLLGHKVDNIVMEYSPGVAERQHDWKMYEDNPAALARLLNANYTILHLESTLPGASWEGPLPALESVTKEVLKNDLEDAYRLQAGTLGCPLPEELKAASGMWSCQNLPEALHPQSFRATFGHNTNVWAVQGGSPSAALATPGAPASLFPLDFDLKAFFSPNGLGAARRACTGLTPDVQVRHRCHCSDKAVCGELEDLVARLSAEGKVPPLGSPPPKEAVVGALLLQDLHKAEKKAEQR